MTLADTERMQMVAIALMKHSVVSSGGTGINNYCLFETVDLGVTGYFCAVDSDYFFGTVVVP